MKTIETGKKLWETWQENSRSLGDNHSSTIVTKNEFHEWLEFNARFLLMGRHTLDRPVESIIVKELKAIKAENDRIIGSLHTIRDQLGLSSHPHCLRAYQALADVLAGRDYKSSLSDVMMSTLKQAHDALNVLLPSPMCRDCADEDGTCPNTYSKEVPCEQEDAKKWAANFRNSLSMLITTLDLDKK